MKKVSLIKGDGIGQEIGNALVELFESLNFPIEFEEVQAGADYYEKSGELISDETFESIEKNKVAIKGPLTTPIGEGFRSINVQLRKKYDLYANIRPIRTIIPGKFDNIDQIIFRENTEDLYAGIEERVSDDERRSIKIITREKSDRIIRRAFEYAKENNINKVTIVTKANIMKETDGLFLQIGREIQEEFSNILLEEVLVDNMAMQLVMNPEKYQVIVTQNLYGDILSDLSAGLVGGLGLVPGANIGKEIALFEPAHGSAPDIAGKNLANPTALFLSAVMMLEHIGDKDLAENLEKAILKTLQDKNSRTKDLGGNLSTDEFTKKIIENY